MMCAVREVLSICQVLTTNGVCGCPSQLPDSGDKVGCKEARSYTPGSSFPLAHSFNFASGTRMPTKN